MSQERRRGGVFRCDPSSLAFDLVLSLKTLRGVCRSGKLLRGREAERRRGVTVGVGGGVALSFEDPKPSTFSSALARRAHPHAEAPFAKATQSMRCE